MDWKPTFADLFWLVMAVAWVMIMVVCFSPLTTVCTNGYRASLASFGYVECEVGR